MARGRRNRIAEIGELQLAVLDILKDIGEGTVHGVLDRFPQGDRPRYTTVMTVLRALEKKGLAAHRTQDRAFVYRPTEEAATVRRQVLREVVDRVFGGSPTRLMATLLNEEDVTPEVAVEMRRLLEESREAGDE